MKPGAAALRRCSARPVGSALQAAPTFAVMAILTYLSGGDADTMCAAAQGVSPLSGMVPMYVLMSAFHSAPWLKLISAAVPAGRKWVCTTGA
jgi:hypothetical protein